MASEQQGAAMWKWMSWVYQVRRQELTAFIWFVPLLWIGGFIWRAGYQLMAVILVVGATLAGLWLQWALWSAQLKPWAGRSGTAINDPVYDIPLQDAAAPSNPAADPLYDIEDHDFTEDSSDPLTDPLADPLAVAPKDEEKTPPAAS